MKKSQESSFPKKNKDISPPEFNFHSNLGDWNLLACQIAESPPSWLAECPLLDALADPPEVLSSVAQLPKPAYKLLSWLSYIQSNLTNFDTIQQEQLGPILNKCVEALNAIKGEAENDPFFNQLKDQLKKSAIGILATASREYINQDGLAIGRAGLAGSVAKEVRVAREALRQQIPYLSNDRPQNPFTWVIAKEKETERYSIARSGRIWMPDYLEEVNRKQKDWEDVFASDTFHLAPVSIPPITIDILTAIGAEILAFKEWTGDLDMVSRNFAGRVGNIFGIHDQDQKQEYFLRFKKYFELALTQKKWNDLEAVMGNRKWSHQINLASKDVEDILSIISDDDPVTPKAQITMWLATFACGEPKIALEYCRELSLLSTEEKEQLPATLGERLELSSFKSNRQTGEIDSKVICIKCLHSWVLLESFYWAIRQTGVELGTIEQLDGWLFYI
ncbi:MAG TPA: hypothetical protein VLE95_06835 [Chlamydiales bacterium]|nr:hypothetical protein [Chlamydiales bacterium]